MQMGRLTGLMVIFVIVMAWNYDNRSSMYQSSTSSHLGAMIKGYLRNKPVLSLHLDQKRLQSWVHMEDRIEGESLAALSRRA